MLEKMRCFGVRLRFYPQKFLGECSGRDAAVVYLERRAKVRFYRRRLAQERLVALEEYYQSSLANATHREMQK